MGSTPSSRKGLRYTQLDQHTQEIRLVTLGHGEANADIDCQLIHTTLGRHPPYKALSYSWDIVKVLYQIDVDGCPFGIGPNLKAALQSIRHPEEPRYLWIDAICINQKDIAERNHQVTIMHWIYQQALQVIIWLGKKSFDSDCAMDVLEDEDIGRKLNMFPASATAIRYTAKEMVIWKALSHFFARSYWYRVWVMQEVVWSADILIMCGTREMSWDSLLRGSLYIRQAVDTVPNNLTVGTLIRFCHVSFISEMMDIRAKRLGSLPLGIESLLAKIRVRKSSDPRDRIFGILNLLPLEEWPCPPDYSKDAAQVYSEVAQRIIERSRSLSLLGACEHAWLPVGIHEHLREAYRTPEIPGLPSWTPNWAVARASVPLGGGCESFSLPLQTAEDKASRFAASGNSIAKFDFSADMTTLRVRGFAFDIVKVSDNVSWITLSDACQPRLYDIMERVAFHERPMNSVYAGRMSRLEAFCRTMVLDKPPNGTSFDSGAVMQYLQWRNRSSDHSPDVMQARHVIQGCGGRFFFCSAKGYIGFGPLGTAAGDLLCVIHGCHVPIVLRKRLAYYLAGGAICAQHKDFRSCLLSGCSNEIISWEKIRHHYIVIGEACECLVPTLFFTVGFEKNSCTSLACYGVEIY